jgi:hypothetical protein
MSVMMSVVRQTAPYNPGTALSVDGELWREFEMSVSRKPGR